MRKKERKEKGKGGTILVFFWMEGKLHRKLLAKVLEGLIEERRVIKSKWNAGLIHKDQRLLVPLGGH